MKPFIISGSFWKVIELFNWGIWNIIWKTHRDDSSDELYRRDAHSNADQNSNKANCEEVSHYDVHHIVVDHATWAGFWFTHKRLWETILIFLLTCSHQIANHQTLEVETARNKDQVGAIKWDCTIPKPGIQFSISSHTCTHHLRVSKWLQNPQFSACRLAWRANQYWTENSDQFVKKSHNMNLGEEIWLPNQSETRCGRFLEF